MENFSRKDKFNYIIFFNFPLKIRKLRLINCKRYKTRVIMRHILLTFATIIFTLTATAQRGNQQYFNPLTDDITQYLPPLSALLDTAVENSPSVNFESLKTDFYRYNVKTEKRNILEHLGLSSELNNGRFYYNDWNEGFQEPEFYYSESRRFNYELGVYVRLPISSIVDRRNRINKQKKWVEISMAREQEVAKQVRREVITLYNNLLESQRILKITNDYLQWTYVQMQMAENQFVNGQISTAEMTRLKEFQRRGQTEFAKQKAAFKSAYDQLQELVGMKFNKIKGLD